MNGLICGLVPIALDVGSHYHSRVETSERLRFGVDDLIKGFREHFDFGPLRTLKSQIGYQFLVKEHLIPSLSQALQWPSSDFRTPFRTEELRESSLTSGITKFPCISASQAP